MIPFFDDHNIFRRPCVLFEIEFSLFKLQIQLKLSIRYCRCANCFDCPSCGHTLSVRATTLHPVIPNPLSSPLEPGSKDVSSPLIKKMHYLFCSFCRWTSRDVGLPDQATPSGGWGEQEVPHGKSMLSLLEYYKQVCTMIIDVIWNVITRNSRPLEQSLVNLVNNQIFDCFLGNTKAFL